jgi:protein SCO1
MSWFRAMLVALLFLLPCTVRAESFRPFEPPLSVGPFALNAVNAPNDLGGGAKVTREDLRGKVWVAHFFYCTCQEGCAETTATMAKLQRAFADNDDVLLVSIHLYPQGEDAELLRRYAQSFGADPKRWLFLTGDKDTVYEVVEKSFFLSVAERAEKKPGHEVAHRFALMLIDQDGRIRGYVEGKDAEAANELERHITELLPWSAFRASAKAILPSVNAGLNGLCAVLLIAGYVAIRRRRERTHIVFMVSALGVSLIFLTSYLFYHFVILDGRPTHFRGTGWVWRVYMGILGSHTVLAALVAPLALVTAYLGWRDRRAAHRRLARWTLPIWLYVSLTGVVVYWMLYHLYGPV